MTSEHTYVAMASQQKLTQAIQDRLQTSAEKVEEKRRKKEQEQAALAEVSASGDEWTRFISGLYGEDPPSQRKPE